MTSDFKVICLRIDGDSPSQDEVSSEMLRILYQYRDIGSYYMNLESSGDNYLVFPGSIQRQPNFNFDKVIDSLISNNFSGGSTYVCYNQLNHLLTIINFPKNGKPIVIYLDKRPLSENIPFDKLMGSIQNRTLSLTHDLSADDDIRSLLLGRLRNRRGLFLSGSPGWGDKGVNFRSILKKGTSKNEACLDATFNDANIMFQTIHSLTSDDVLSGLVSGFVIQKKNLLLLLLELIPYKSDLVFAQTERVSIR